MEEKANWTDKQHDYIRWLVLPKADREKTKIPTREAFAELFDVSLRTLSRWVVLPGFQDAVYQEARRELDWCMVDILKALGDKAKSGDVPSIKLALVLTGRMADSLNIVHEVREYGGDKLIAARAEMILYEKGLLDLEVKREETPDDHDIHPEG